MQRVRPRGLTGQERRTGKHREERLLIKEQRIKRCPKQGQTFIRSE